MSIERPNYLAMPGMREAVDEIEGSIRAVHPRASFALASGEDPDGLYVSAVVEIDDLDTVVDLFVDRLVELQVEAGLPLYVVPVRPPQQVTVELIPAPRRRRTTIAPTA